MTQSEQLIAELKHEGQSTRRLLKRIPEDKLSWKPHPKSMSLGTLGLHIAGVPKGIADILTDNPAELPDVPLIEATSVEQILVTHETCLEYAAEQLQSWSYDDLVEVWTLTANGHPIMSQPRGAVVRSLMMNHVYHHRGQLTVYLRLLDVPVPGLYGPSADD